MDPFRYLAKDDGALSSSSAPSSSRAGANNMYGTYASGGASSSGYQNTQAGSSYGSSPYSYPIGYGSASAGFARDQYRQASASRYVIPSASDYQAPAYAASPSLGSYDALYPGSDALAGDFQASEPAEEEAHQPVAEVALPVNPLRTTIMIVPDSTILPNRQAASGEDRTCMTLHHLIPSAFDNQQIGWLREAVTHELRQTMLQRSKIEDVLFNAREGQSARSAYTVGLYDPRESVVAGSTEQVDQEMLRRYLKWAAFQCDEWDKSFRATRSQGPISRVPRLIIDMHSVSKEVASLTIAEYARQGGFVVTDTILASEPWTRASKLYPGGRQRGQPWDKMNRQGARLAITRSQLPTMSSAQPPARNIWEAAHCPTLLLLTRVSAETYSAEARYHMLLPNRMSLDEYLRQRGIVDNKVRVILDDSELYVGGRSPRKHIQGALKQSSTERAPITLVSPEEAAAGLNHAKDAKKPVETGQVAVSLGATFWSDA